MKTIKLLLVVAVLLSSCSASNDNECNCNKLTYNIEQNVVMGSNGLPILVTEHVLLSTEPVGCQDETTVQLEGNKYYKIECE